MQSTVFIIQNSLLSGIFLQKDKLSNVRGFLFFISSKGVEQLSSVLYINIGSIGLFCSFLSDYGPWNVEYITKSNVMINIQSRLISSRTWLLIEVTKFLDFEIRPLSHNRIEPAFQETFTVFTSFLLQSYSGRHATESQHLERFPLLSRIGLSIIWGKMNRSNLFFYEQNQVDLKKITNKADDMLIAVTCRCCFYFMKRNWPN